MNNIIQHFAEEGMKRLQERILTLVKGGQGLTSVVSEIKKETDALGRALCIEVIEALDQSIVKDSRRKKNWYVERKNEEKTIITKLGELTYKRTYFCSKRGKQYRHLVDDILEIGIHERIDKEVYAELAELACDLSYRKTGKSLGETCVSGQTVMKSVRGIEKLKVEKFQHPKKVAETLYVEADEDHIALQNGRSAMPRLIYVHEGVTNDRGRRSLKSPYYLSSLKGKPEELWQETYEYIEDNYEIDKIKTIYLSGDGAQWIKTGLNHLPNAKFVLDKYHMSKYVTKATAHKEEYAVKIWDSLKKADLDELGLVINDLYFATENENKRKEIMDSYSYFKNNWSGIDIQQREYNKIVGCSAEGHISHILSARMSSRPMGWSIDGADKMASLRAFKANKGKVYDFLKAQKQEKKLYKITRSIMKQTSKGLKSKANEHLGNITVFNTGRITGLYKEIKSMC